MSTELQKNLAREIVANSKSKKPKNKKELLVSVGYADKTAEKNQKAVLNQKGVKKELKVLGFDITSAKRVVQSIMLDETVDPNARLKATDQVFKVQGGYAPEKHQTIVAHIDARRKARIDRILGIK